jgi:hypothetical protein
MRPAQQLAEIAQQFHWDIATQQRKREALSVAYQRAAFEDPDTLAIFAHGDQLVRARLYHAHAAVETYNIHVQGWDRRAIDLFAWDAIATAADWYSHAGGRAARQFFVLPIHVRPEADGSLPVTPLYSREPRPQGYGVFELVDGHLFLLAAYHRGHEDRARTLACELLVHDETSATAIRRHLDLLPGHDVPQDARRISTREFEAFAIANAAPRGTKIAAAFDDSPHLAWPAYLPVDPHAPAYSVADFRAAATRTDLAPLLARVASTGVPHIVDATAVIARALFDYVGPGRELDATFDVRAFEHFCAEHSLPGYRPAQSVATASAICTA